MNRRYRILSLIHDFNFGGDEARILAFAQGLDVRRFEHKVVAIHQADPEQNQRYGTIRQQFVEAGVLVEDLGERHAQTVPASLLRPDHVVHKGWILFRVVRKLRRLIRAWSADIVDAHNNIACVVGGLAGMLTRTRTVLTLYSPGLTMQGWPPIAFSVGQFVAGMADAIVTDSHARSQDIRQWMFWSPARLVVIPNGPFPPASTRTCEEMRQLLDLPKDPKVRVIGQVSRLVESKGHMVLLTAARAVLQNEPNTVFLFVGYDNRWNATSYKEQLQHRAAALGIADRVRIVGYPGPIGDVWKAIDIHVHASLLDSLPNAIIEGMSLAKPAVVTSVGGIVEIVDHERTGLVIPPNDPEALSQALLQLLREPETAQRFGEAAYRRYMERYQPEMTTRKLENLFGEILTGKSHKLSTSD